MPTFSIQIAAPPEPIFEEISHVERHPSWANPKANMQMEQWRTPAIKKDAMTSLGNLKRMMESKATAGGTV
jgi:hypothetical protein